MLFMFHGRLEKPADMTSQEFYALWEEESEAAVELLGAGTIKWAYKVAGQPEVVALIDVQDNGGIDGLLNSLPIYRKGYSQIVKDLKWFPLREYADWYAELKTLAHPH
jgi:muconolactone delta-isomerase